MKTHEPVATAMEGTRGREVSDGNITSARLTKASDILPW